MATEQEITDIKKENGSVADPDNEDQPMAETGSQADDTSSVPNQQARSDTSPPANHLVDEVNDRPAGRQVDRSTFSLDRIPDMYVRVSQPITNPATFELICTRIFLEAWQGDPSTIRLEDFTLEHETLPGYEPFCATPDCNCEQ